MGAKTKLFIILFSLIFAWGCEKEEIILTNDPIVITLESGEEYTYDFKISGDEEGATIISQAKHAEISEIIRNESTNWSVVYRYIPQSGFIGTDSVKIETFTGSDGCACGTTNQVSFHFTVTN